MKEQTIDNITESVLEQNATCADPRFKEIMESLIRHLHDFAREVHLTPGEWIQGIEFLTKVGQTCTPNRQEFILLSDTLGFSSLINLLHDATRTEEATHTSNLGPFFREEAPQMKLGDKIVEGDDSREICLYGKVTDVTGKPIANAKMDIWQASSRGTYDMQENPDQGHMDYRAQFRTDENGNYWLRTVEPIGYYIPLDGPVGDMIRAQSREGARPAHIHYMVSSPGYRELITAIYFPGQYLESDTVFGAAGDLVVHVNENDANAPIKGLPAVHFDLTLARESIPSGTGRMGADPSKIAEKVKA